MKKEQEDKINWTMVAAIAAIVIIIVTIYYGQKSIEAQKPVLSLNPVKFEENDLFILYEEDQLKVDIEVENKGKTLAKIDGIKSEDIKLRVKSPKKGIDVAIEGDSSVEKNILASGEKTNIGLTYEPINKGDIEFFRNNQAYFYVDIKVNYTGDSFFKQKCYISRTFEVKNEEVVFGIADSDCVK